MVYVLGNHHIYTHVIGPCVHPPSNTKILAHIRECVCHSVVSKLATDSQLILLAKIRIPLEFKTGSLLNISGGLGAALLSCYQEGRTLRILPIHLKAVVANLLRGSWNLVARAIGSWDGQVGGDCRKIRRTHGTCLDCC